MAAPEGTLHYLVYRLTNQVNEKVYVGVHQTSNPEDGYMGSGSYLQRAIKKHGVDSFTKEILYDFSNAEEMFQKEAEIVDEEFVKRPDTYNIKIGGHGGWDYVNRSGLSVGWNLVNASRSPEEKKRIAAKARAFAGSTGAKKLNALIKAGFLDPPFKGKTHSLETKKKMSESHRKFSGSLNSQYGTRWITNGVSNRKISKLTEIPNGWKLGRIRKKH